MRRPKEVRVQLVHVPDEDHGISWYGDRLAAFLSTSDRVAVLPARAGRGALSVFTEVWCWLKADVVHVQWSSAYWGETWSAVLRAATLAVVARFRPVVLTMHDVHHEPAEPSTGEPATSSMTLSMVSAPARPRARRTQPRVLAQAIATRATTEVLVFSPEEQVKVAAKHARATTVLPLFVEEYEAPIERPDEDRLVVFGYIHPRKGQLLAVEALPLLPGARLTLCGAATPAHAAYLEQIHIRAAQLGVSDRLDVTGFVEEDELTRVLARTRVAVCPYKRIAASGSISSLVSRGVPIVAHSTAFTRRLHDRAPRGVTLFSPWVAEELAAAVRGAIDDDLEDQRAQLQSLADAFSPAATRSRHESVYLRLAGVTEMPK